MRSALSALGLLACLVAPAAAQSAPAPAPLSEVLEEYVRRAQPAYAWRVTESEERADGMTLHRIALTSQVWQGITWSHRLNLLVPPAAEGERARPGHAVLVITGSGGEKQHIAIITGLALRLGVPVAILHDVPNQPLFKDQTANGRGLKEDALIAYTFGRFAETGDRDWPALLPMTRSAVAAMDALGELSRQRAAEDPAWSFGVLEKFVTTGGSKRGWTSWLSAVADGRVVGIAPIVFDNLDFEEQIRLHYETWGHPSPSIHDYTDRGLLEMFRSARGQELLGIVDPFSYAQRLDLPKLALIGTNDTYWPLESIHVYKGRLPGDLSCHYVPNGGHSAGLSVVDAVAGFFDAVTARIPALPDVDLSILPRVGAAITTADAADRTRVRRVRLWAARVSDRDFTKAQWVSTEGEAGEEAWQAPLPERCLAKDGRAAFIGEVELDDSAGRSFLIHSPVQVWELGPSD